MRDSLALSCAACPMELLCCSPLSSGVLSGRAICATKLIAWLRAVLKGSGLSPEHFTGHSAKTTTLSWMAKANISEATRCVLGHHTPKGTTAVITYARDEQSGPLRELAIVYRHKEWQVQARRQPFGDVHVDCRVAKAG